MCHMTLSNIPIVGKNSPFGQLLKKIHYIGIAKIAKFLPLRSLHTIRSIAKILHPEDLRIIY